MSSSDEAQKAIQALNGSDLGGRTLTVNEARPQERRSGGGFGGGGGGGGVASDAVAAAVGIAGKF